MRGKRTEQKEREPQRSSSSAVWPQRGFSQYENIDSATLPWALRAVLGACDGAEGICVCVCVAAESPPGLSAKEHVWLNTATLTRADS